MSPSGQPSQGGPAEPDQASEQHGGWQHSMHTYMSAQACEEGCSNVEPWDNLKQRGMGNPNEKSHGIS